MSYTIGQAFGSMTSDMRNKLSNYQLSLEHRYGDPRTYALEREQMAAEQAMVSHSESRSVEQVLSAAYDKKRSDIRGGHASRMTRFAQDKPLQYLEPEQSAVQKQKRRAPQRRSVGAAARAPSLATAR